MSWGEQMGDKMDSRLGVAGIPKGDIIKKEDQPKLIGVLMRFSFSEVR